jgi:DNA-binding transcriptional LysR family regulator
MTVCLYVLPPVLKRFRALYPKVELSVTNAASAIAIEALRRHELDLALLTLPIVADDLEVRPALREEMVVVTAPGHPLSKKRPVTPEELARYPLVLYEPGSNTRRVQDELFLEEKVAVRVAMETENVEIIKAMVSHGLGVSIIPFAAAAKDVKAGRLAHSRLRGRRLHRETGWVYLKSDYVPKTVSEVLRVFDMVKNRYLHASPRRKGPFRAAGPSGES